MPDNAKTVEEIRTEAKFKMWMHKVDQAVLKKVGVSVHDLPDISFRDYFDDGMTPSEVAGIALEEAGWGG